MKRSAYYSEYPFNASASESQSSIQRGTVLRQRLQTLWQRLMNKLVSQPPELQVWYTCDPQGHLWWSAYDPITQRRIDHVSETAIRIWVEKRDKV